MNKMDCKKEERQIGPCEKEYVIIQKFLRYCLCLLNSFAYEFCTAFERLTYIKTWIDKDIHPL